MDDHLFDLIARTHGGTGSRRQALRLLFSGALAPMLIHLGRSDAAAACHGFNKPCGKNAACCPGSGLRCRDGRCRCRDGKQHCVPGPACQDVAKDPAHCGGCGRACPAHKPCCIGGTCRPKCGATCCADCFVEVIDGVPNFPAECCNASKVCRRKPGRQDDRCCYPDEVCLKSGCCSNLLFGTTNCNGACCPKGACCNGACCRKGHVCARKHGSAKRHCVPANRACTSKAQCFPNELCHGGTCCSGNRICQTNDASAPLCCRADEYCEFVGLPIARCTKVGSSASTTRGHRIRP